jgi:hypothetical protein
MNDGKGTLGLSEDNRLSSVPFFLASPSSVFIINGAPSTGKWIVTFLLKLRFHSVTLETTHHLPPEPEGMEPVQLTHNSQPASTSTGRAAPGSWSPSGCRPSSASPRQRSGSDLDPAH